MVHCVIWATNQNVDCKRKDRIPYVTAVRDCNEVHTCEAREKQQPEGMRGPGKEQQNEHLTFKQ